LAKSIIEEMAKSDNPKRRDLAERINATFGERSQG